MFDIACMALLENVTYVQCDAIPITEATTMGEAAERVTASLAKLFRTLLRKSARFTT